MRTVLFLLALLPWANAQSTSSASQASDRSITIQSSGDLESCSTVSLQWVPFGLSGTRIPFTINYTNNGTGVAVTKVISGVAATVTDANLAVTTWRVNVPTTGLYIFVGSAQGVEIYPSEPFTVTVSNTSCYQTTLSPPTSTVAPIVTTSSTRTSTKSTKSSSTPLGVPTPSLASSDPQVPSSGHTSRVVGIVGAIVGTVIFVALLVALFFCHRKRSLKARTYANSKPEKPEMPKGHRRWGGLSSVDSAAVLDGIPTFPYTGFVNANSRDESVHKTTADETAEKRRPGHEEESPTDEVLTHSPRSYNRGSNGMLSPPQQKSGLATFNNERARTASLKGASPASSFVSDPFFDNSPRTRGIRSQSLSAPPTAQPSPRSSNRPALSTTPTQEVPGSLRGSEGGWSESLWSHNAGMRRSTSTNTATRPVRKPVPQYDPSIEMTATTLGAHSSYLQHSAQNSVTNFTSDSHTVLSSSVDSTSPWLADRVPVANRNIGLASQGDGPVHYLMPDMPPPPRV